MTVVLLVVAFFAILGVLVWARWQGVREDCDLVGQRRRALERLAHMHEQAKQ